MLTRFLLLFILISPTYCINNNIYDIAKFLNHKSFDISGEFFYYDFKNTPSHWDYVFKPTGYNIYLRLRGKPSQINDIFGWKRVDISIYNSSDYLFVYLGDFDKDSDTRFDWLLLQSSSLIVYKLKGNTLDNTFNWSEALPVTFSIEDNMVSFESKNYKAPGDTPIFVKPTYTPPTSSILPTYTTPSTVDNEAPPSIPTSPNTNLELPPSL